MRDNLSSISIHTPTKFPLLQWTHSRTTQFLRLYRLKSLVSSAFIFPLLCVSGLICSVAEAQKDTDIQSQIPDVSILVVPTSQNSARISVAYRKEVTKDQVKQDISRLALKGWTVAPRIELQNRSMRPGDIVNYPATTSATFSVSGAPQFINGVPDILTYARAFQQWDHIAALVSVASRRSSTEVQKFDSPVITVERTQEESLDHYEIIIKDHTGVLPAIVFGTKESGVQGVISKPSDTGLAKPDLFSKILPFTLLIVGAGILTGAGTYLIFSKWSKKSEKNS